jgi:hypothetical protein
MAKAPTKFVIDERTYIIGDWTVDRSLETLVWLTKTFGEGILQLFIHEDGLDAADRLISGTPEEVDGQEVKTSEEDKQLANEFVSKILRNLDPREYSAYCKAILQGVKCNAQDINFNVHFQGRIAELHNVIFQVLRHQYSDFLGGSGGSDS